MHSHNNWQGKTLVYLGLNPCCNGRCTRTYDDAIVYGDAVLVLILVVMEDALAQGKKVVITGIFKVLILVVMEDALAPQVFKLNSPPKPSLNPCCNGRCTRTF